MNVNGRERVKNAMHYLAPDRVPLQFYYSPVGYYEHGDRLNDLYARYPGDFGPFETVPVPCPAPGDFGPDGKFRSFRRDGWGTLWEYRIYGVAGIPSEYPLSDISRLDGFKTPEPPELSGPEFENFRNNVKKHQQNYYYLHGAGNLFERLIALRPENDVLCGIELDEPEINALADKITRYDSYFVRRAILAGADGLGFGDGCVLPFPQHGDGQPACDGEEPWENRLRGVEAADLPPCAEKGFLGEVFGVVAVAGEAEQETEHARVVPPHDPVEGLQRAGAALASEPGVFGIDGDHDETG